MRQEASGLLKRLCPEQLAQKWDRLSRCRCSSQTLDTFRLDPVVKQKVRSSLGLGSTPS